MTNLEPLAELAQESWKNNREYLPAKKQVQKISTKNPGIEKENFLLDFLFNSFWSNDFQIKRSLTHQQKHKNNGWSCEILVSMQIWRKN